MPEQTSPKRTFDVTQVAGELDVTASTVRRWARHGVLTTCEPARGQHPELRFSEDEVARARRLIQAGGRASKDQHRLMLQLVEEMQQVRSELALLHGLIKAAAPIEDQTRERHTFRSDSWAAAARETGTGGRILPFLTPRARQTHSIRAEALREFEAGHRSGGDLLTGTLRRARQASKAIQQHVRAASRARSGVADGRLKMVGYDARGGQGSLRMRRAADEFSERRSA